MPDEWLKWKHRFEHLLSASDLDKEDEARQVTTPLYCLGDEVHNVIASMDISNTNRKKYTKVLEKFYQHFDVKKNVNSREPALTRNQVDCEIAMEYITVPYNVVETCKYGDLKEQILRDRLVGIRDTSVSQMNAKLTLIRC